MIARKHTHGFTLIESIIAIVIMAFAMISLTTFLFPQVQDSARPHYEVRASALAQSLMTEVISKNFDENSDPDNDGGILRCGETGAGSCTTTFGPEGDEISGEDRFPGLFNDVDDYVGCWTTNSASEQYCPEGEDSVGSLSDIFGNSISDEYPNFAASISVAYDNDSALTGGNTNVIKRVTIVITAGQYGDYSFSAYRGNY